MRPMKDKHIAQLESRLESLIEGAFAHFFGRKIRAQDIALELARAMEDGLRAGDKDDYRPLAPELYNIYVSQETAAHLRQRQPNLNATLSRYLVDLATNAGYRLDTAPVIDLIADEGVAVGDVRVSTNYLDPATHSTNVMERVTVPKPDQKPTNAQLVVGNRSVPLRGAIVNVGRSLDNHIVLDDTTVSRHHAQIRLRFGSYMLFDVRSRGGTLVNDEHIQEHTLRSGDVIQMGDTRLLYLQDDPPADTTGLLAPVDAGDGQ